MRESSVCEEPNVRGPLGNGHMSAEMEGKGDPSEKAKLGCLMTSVAHGMLECSSMERSKNDLVTLKDCNADYSLRDQMGNALIDGKLKIDNTNCSGRDHIEHAIITGDLEKSNVDDSGTCHTRDDIIKRELRNGRGDGIVTLDLKGNATTDGQCCGAKEREGDLDSVQVVNGEQIVELKGEESQHEQKQIGDALTIVSDVANAQVTNEDEMTEKVEMEIDDQCKKIHVNDVPIAPKENCIRQLCLNPKKNKNGNSMEPKENQIEGSSIEPKKNQVTESSVEPEKNVKDEDSSVNPIPVTSEENEIGLSVSPGRSETANMPVESKENLTTGTSVKPEEKLHRSSSVKTENNHCEVDSCIKKDIENGEYPVCAESADGSALPLIMYSQTVEVDDSGTEEEQATFMKELENFYKGRCMEFKPPKFYGEGLNCLKLWRAVTRLGGYEQVTVCKLWRHVGEFFKPPKTCTTISWSFRCFYEKALLEYEKHKILIGELQVPISCPQEITSVDNQVGNTHISGSGRARRDSAARAMQGWHSQRLLGNGEVSEPIIKDKSTFSFLKRGRRNKCNGILKRKRPSSFEVPSKAESADIDKSHKTQMDNMIVDIGLPADWVKINVRRTKDCFEIYVLTPGLLREEVHVQSDPAGRVVISGEPEQLDNPWGVTPFKKIVTLPSRIDAYQTSAIVTLHGQLFVRAPFEQQAS